ncbi:MAG: hypothetical protein L6R37_001950 [Teloschistes peruensis]|nr:MAG: hypothetical protein L6R37_001950 [Teloschistes peruensis]
MFGAFRPTSPLSGGLLWKIPWRLSAPQKARQRKRLRAVDSVVACVDTALRKQGSSMKDLDRWKAEMPREEEMRPKDKYTIFDRKEKRYRKGIHTNAANKNPSLSLREGSADETIQSCPNGRESVNESILPVSKMATVTHIGLESREA